MEYCQRKGLENFQSNCRLCLELLDNETEGKSVEGNLEMKINEIFPSNVLRSPTASTSSLCISCYAQFNDFYHFRSTIIKKHSNREQFELCEIKMEQIDFNPVVNILAIKEEDLGNYEFNPDDWNSEADAEINSECDQRELDIPQSQFVLEKALKEIDKGSSITDAALKFKISESHLKDFGDRSVSPQEFDRKIANWIITSGELCDPKTKRNVLDAATHLSKLNSSTMSHEFNDSWFRSFLKRNPHVLLPKVLRLESNAATDLPSDNSDNETSWIKKLGKRKKSFSEKTMKLALEEVENGGKLYATAQKYKIASSTLQGRLKNGGFKCKSRQPLIPFALEPRLAEWIVACNELGETKKHSNICEIASHLIKLQKRNNNHVIVKNWVDSFLRRHPETLIEPAKSKFECDMCGQQYLNKFSLKNHFPDFHFNTKNGFKCKICEKTLCSVNSLKTHALEQHPTPGRSKNFVCYVCGMGFYTKVSLDAHAVIHKEKKFYCDFEGCNRKFLRSTELEKHKRNDHYGIKDFKCQFPGCNKGYSNNPRLRRHHKETHDEKPKCPVNNCNFHIGRAAYMRRHLKKHTDIDFQELQEYLLIFK